MLLGAGEDKGRHGLQGGKSQDPALPKVEFRMFTNCSHGDGAEVDSEDWGFREAQGSVELLGVGSCQCVVGTWHRK